MYVHFAWKGRSRNDLYCVRQDVKPCSFTRSCYNEALCETSYVWKLHMSVLWVLVRVETVWSAFNLMMRWHMFVCLSMVILWFLYLAITTILHPLLINYNTDHMVRHWSGCTDWLWTRNHPNVCKLVMSDCWFLAHRCCDLQSKAEGSHDRLNDDAKLTLYLNGKKVVHFPVNVYGTDLLQVKASFPAGKQK